MGRDFILEIIFKRGLREVSVRIKREKMFRDDKCIEPFEEKVWLPSQTMHGLEIEYVREAYETKWG